MTFGIHFEFVLHLISIFKLSSLHWVRNNLVILFVNYFLFSYRVNTSNHVLGFSSHPMKCNIYFRVKMIILLRMPMWISATYRAHPMKSYGRLQISSTSKALHQLNFWRKYVWIFIKILVLYRYVQGNSISIWFSSLSMFHVNTFSFLRALHMTFFSNWVLVG